MKDDFLTLDINTFYAQLQNIIINAAEAAIPKTVPKSNKKFNPWWNKDCKVALKKEQKANKQNFKNNTAESLTKLKAATVNRKAVIAKAKVEYWKKRIDEEIIDYRDTGKLWKMVKNSQGERKKNITPLIHGGEKYVTNKDKAQLLAQQIAYKSQNI